VTITRRLRGQAVSVGGRDHTSHRLVALGLSERRAVLILYAICLAFSGIALLGLQYNAFIVGTAVTLAAIVVLIFGMFLGQDRLYRPVTPSEATAPGTEEHGFVIGTFVAHKRRMIEVLIDSCLFGAALVGAYLIRFEGTINDLHLQHLLFALPIVIAIKLVCFWGFGMYRRVWAFVGVHDLVAMARAVFTSSLVCILTMWTLTRLDGYSRAAFLLDGILTLMLTAGSRILFRVFQETLAPEVSDGKRVVIVGAGRAGEVVLREIRRDHSLGYRAVGFVDDDPDKQGRRIHGLRILGGREILPALSKRDAFDEVILAIPSLEEEDQEELLEICQATGKVTRVMRRVSSTFLQ
jgi:UDP-GlcNAc:undecaprenyl-phosphate/decaprenyl-phosphate GlcNAc-1-phosphate transferase